METLTEANEMCNQLEGLKREFYKKVNHIEKEGKYMFLLNKSLNIARR